MACDIADEAMRSASVRKCSNCNNKMPAGPVRLNIKVSTGEAEILQRLAAKYQVSVTTIVRKAIQVSDFLSRNVSDNEHVSLQLVERCSSGREMVTQLKILPGV